MRLIDADELIKKAIPENNDAQFRCVALKDVINAPTVEPESQVYPGEWVEIPDDEFAPKVVCSACGNIAIVDAYGEYQQTRYCPYCGARMEGE